MPANVQSVAPAWQTAELQDEWIEPEDENGDDEDDNLTYGTRSISLTAPLATHIYTNTKDGGDASLLQPLATGGTFLIREDIPSEPLLVKTPGRPKKGIIKDFFSPLPLERMFEPPSPPSHKSAKAHIPLSNPSQPSHGVPQDEIVETDMPDMNSFHGRKAGLACKFTFAVPRESLCLSTPKLAADADADADNPQAQSTPYPSFPLTKTAPTTDPRLRLFQFQYDTYTREHLSAMVDSIALNSGTGTTPSPTSVIHLSRVSEDEGSVETMSRLRSAKRVKLSPRSDYGEGASIARPAIESKHQVRVIKPDDSQSGGASSTAASYRQQAATLMAQIKNDMKGQKRIFSGSTETSYADDKVSSFSSSADVSRTKSNPKPSRRLPADPDNLVENVARLSMHDRRSFSSSSLHSSQHRTSSSRTASLSSRPLSTLSTAPSSYPSSSLRTTDDLNRFVSSSTASGTTLTSNSGVPSFVKHAGPPHIRTIAPADIPPVPEVYNGMVYDKVMMKWVRSGRCVSEEPSEDPFGDIESLKDESREREGEHDRQVYPGEMSRIEERSEADDEELNSFSTDEPSAYIVDVMTGVDTFEDTIDSADEDENGGFEQYEAGPPPVVAATPQRTPAIRSAMKSTPLHRADRRSVSFSDGRREGPIQGLDDLTGIVQSARSKRIAQLMEALEEDAGDDTVREETHAVAYLIHGETSSVGTSRQVFSRSRITNANATFLTECSFAVSHDRLVEVITDVEPFTPHWDKLGCIDLSGKRLESVARLKEFLPRLESLNVNSNQLGWLSGIPGSVRTLSAASNSLTGLTSYSHLVNLEKLDISRNDVESLKQLGCLRHLRELKADGNKISSIEGLERMGSLVKLSLQGNCIQTVDFSRNSWARLELLNVCGNRLEKMVGLASLQGLVSLNIDNNELGELELDGPMGKLRVLRISGNRLCELCVGMMRNLRTLYADNNSLTSVVKVEELTKLENLSLRNQSGRGLKIMTREVRDVKRLYLSGNALEEGFLNSACYNLQYLEVAGCRLRRLPSDMGRLVPNLRALNLNYNFVEEVGGLEGLGRLRKLSMIGSRVRSVRGLIRAVQQMPDVEEVDFRMNPCTLEWYTPVLGGDAQDRKFRRDLPDGAYLGRLGYRGLVMGACGRLRVLDGVSVTEKERDKARELMYISAWMIN